MKALVPRTIHDIQPNEWAPINRARYELLIGLVLLSMMNVSTPSEAQIRAQTCNVRSGSHVWLQTVTRYCESAGVPGTLATAVMHHESGGHPYAVRINAGKGYSLYPRTWQDAVRIVNAMLPFTRNIDLGLMQVNLSIWGPHFGLSAAQLLEPTINMRVGCDILRQALSTSGPAWQRIGRYHSGHQARQRHYALKVAQQMETLMHSR